MSKATRWYCFVPLNRITKDIFTKSIFDHPTTCLFSSDLTMVLLKFQEINFPTELADLPKYRLGEVLYIIGKDPNWSNSKTFDLLSGAVKTALNNLNIDPRRKK